MNDLLWIILQRNIARVNDYLWTSSYSSPTTLIAPHESGYGVNSWQTRYEIVVEDGVQYLAFMDVWDGQEELDILVPLNLTIGKTYVLSPEEGNLEGTFTSDNISDLPEDAIWELDDLIWDLSDGEVDLFDALYDGNCQLYINHQEKFTLRPRIVETLVIQEKSRPVLGLEGNGSFELALRFSNCQGDYQPLNVVNISEGPFSAPVGIYFVGHYGARAFVAGQNTSWSNVKDNLRFGTWAVDGANVNVQAHDGKARGVIPGLSGEHDDLFDAWFGWTATNAGQSVWH